MVDAYDPTIFVFDAYPGGVGFSELLFEQHATLLNLAKGLITSCVCEHGCPMCVGPVLEVGPTAKKAALAIIELIEASSPQSGTRSCGSHGINARVCEKE